MSGRWIKLQQGRNKMHKTELNACSQLNMHSLLRTEFLIFSPLWRKRLVPSCHLSSMSAAAHRVCSTVLSDQHWHKDLASDFQIQQGLWLENFKSFKNSNKNTLFNRFTFWVSRCPKILLSNWNWLNTKDYLHFLGAIKMLPIIDGQIKDLSVSQL